MRPIYVLLEPVIPRMYGWPDSENGGDEEPVILEVDTSEVRLLPDLPTFEIPYFAFAGPRGVHWYDRKRGMVERPDPSAVPPAFVPFADDVGVVPYEILATVAARIAIDFTKTAATLAQIPAFPDLAARLIHGEVLRIPIFWNRCEFLEPPHSVEKSGRAVRRP